MHSPHVIPAVEYSRRLSRDSFQYLSEDSVSTRAFPGAVPSSVAKGPSSQWGPPLEIPSRSVVLPLSSDKALSAKTGLSPTTPCRNGVGSKAAALDWSALIKMGAPDSIARALAHG